MTTGPSTCPAGRSDETPLARRRPGVACSAVSMHVFALVRIGQLPQIALVVGMGRLPVGTGDWFQTRPWRTAYAAAAARVSTLSLARMLVT
jgi:hypothetical protein